MTDATGRVLEAVASRLSEIFENDLKYSTYAPERERLSVGVGAVVEVQEFLRPTYDNPANVDTEITYLGSDMGEARTHYLTGVTVRELLDGMDVEVPAHELSWTITNR